MDPETKSVVETPTPAAGDTGVVEQSVGRLPDEAPPQTPPEKKHQGLKSVVSTLAIFLIAPLIALSLTAFFFQSYEVDGPSMETTLQNHDRLIVVKTARTWARITGHTYIPHRGDVIIFSKVDAFDFGVSEKKQLIKRVMGLPGDRVVVKGGILTIYNKDHPNGFQPDKAFPYGKVITTTSGDIDEVIKKDEVFVCGDNRTNSLDSRIFGPIAARDIIGKLSLRVYPVNKAGKF